MPGMSGGSGGGGVLLPWGLLSAEGCASNQAFAPANGLQTLNSKCGSFGLNALPPCLQFTHDTNNQIQVDMQSTEN